MFITGSQPVLVATRIEDRAAVINKKGGKLFGQVADPSDLQEQEVTVQEVRKSQKNILFNTMNEGSLTVVRSSVKRRLTSMNMLRNVLIKVQVTVNLHYIHTRRSD